MCERLYAFLCLAYGFEHHEIYWKIIWLLQPQLQWVQLRLVWIVLPFHHRVPCHLVYWFKIKAYLLIMQLNDFLSTDIQILQRIRFRMEDFVFIAFNIYSLDEIIGRGGDWFHWDFSGFFFHIQTMEMYLRWNRHSHLISHFSKLDYYLATVFKYNINWIFNF